MSLMEMAKGLNRGMITKFIIKYYHFNCCLSIFHDSCGLYVQFCSTKYEKKTVIVSVNLNHNHVSVKYEWSVLKSIMIILYLYFVGKISMFT